MGQIKVVFALDQYEHEIDSVLLPDRVRILSMHKHRTSGVLGRCRTIHSHRQAALLAKDTPQGKQ